jgi:hypothetical protein
MKRLGKTIFEVVVSLVLWVALFEVSFRYKVHGYN